MYKNNARWCHPCQFVMSMLASCQSFTITTWVNYDVCQQTHILLFANGVAYVNNGFWLVVCLFNDPPAQKVHNCYWGQYLHCLTNLSTLAIDYWIHCNICWIWQCIRDVSLLIIRFGSISVGNWLTTTAPLRPLGDHSALLGDPHTHHNSNPHTHPHTPLNTYPTPTLTLTLLLRTHSP